jgi:hypothetical protein
MEESFRNEASLKQTAKVINGGTWVLLGNTMELTKNHLVTVPNLVV